MTRENGLGSVARALLAAGLLSWLSILADPVVAQTAVSVDGVVESRTGGLSFPDGSIQTRAAAPGFARVAKTGLQQCWDEAGDSIPCAATGQDGELQKGMAWPAPRFTDNDDGTVTDNLTGLIWLKDVDCVTISPAAWADALRNANLLSAGFCGLTDGSGAGDWSLPNVRELLSLADFGITIDSYPLPMLPDGHPFVNVVADALLGGYWSSTTTTSPENAHEFRFSSATHSDRRKDTVLPVWPVRRDPAAGSAGVVDTGQRTCFDAAGAPTGCSGTGQDGELQHGIDWPTPRFADNGDGTVIDRLTGLVWLRDANCFSLSPASWTSALAHANGLAPGICGLTDNSAAGDWRLPNIRELESLLDYGATAPLLPAGHPFVHVQPSAYLTSSSTRSGEFTRAVDFQHGWNSSLDKTTAAGVWPVRDGL